ncbi:MAG: MBL fold metallo-hydrolase [Flavonifractor plautii]
MLLLERWTEPLAESNCYLLGEAGRAVVIDPNDPRGPLERLEALGWTPERILLTHEHCDHMAGLEASAKPLARGAGGGHRRVQPPAWGTPGST